MQDTDARHAPERATDAENGARGGDPAEQHSGSIADRVPDTGSLRGDLVAALRRSAATLQGPAGDALRGVLAEALPEPDRVRELRARSRGRNAELMAEVLRRAVARGEIEPAAVLPTRLEVGAALLRNHYFFHDGPLDDDLVVTVVDDVLLPLFGTTRHRAGGG